MSNAIALTEKEKSLTHDLFVMWGKSNQDILSTISNQDLTLDECLLIETDAGAFKAILGESQVIIQEMTFSGDVLGSVYFIQKREEAAVLIDLVIGGDGLQVIDEFGELHMSIFSEMTSQMANSLIGLIANNTSKKVNILPRDIKLDDLSVLGHESLAELSYAIEIEGKMTGKIWFLFPVTLLKGLAALLGEQLPSPAEIARPQAAPVEPSSIPPASAPAPVVLAQPAVFNQLPQPQEKTRAENLDLILDIPVSIKAVLGKVELSVRELIEMTPGKVLELDKLAGEPVELVVNDRLVAHGEIIVVDEKFGVKVMDVLSKAERIYNLK